MKRERSTGKLTSHASWVRFFPAITFLGLVLCSAALWAQEQRGTPGFTAIRSMWNDARQQASENASASLPTFEQAISASPGNNLLLRSALGAAVKGNDKTRLKNWLERYAKQGGSLEAAQLNAISDAIGPSVSKDVLLQLASNAAPMERGIVIASAGPGARLLEGIAYDPTTNSLFLSSVMDSVLVRIDRSGQRIIQLPSQAGSPMGMFVDARRSTLWTAIDSAGPPRNRPGTRSGLLKTDLRELRHSFVPAPPGVESHIGDVAAGADGSVYAADSQSGAIYVCQPGCRDLAVLIPPGQLRSAQGLALSADQRLLYASDYAYGIAVIDLATRSVGQLLTADGVALDGIDGLVRSGETLVAVQNGWQPARVLQIDLDTSGYFATAVKILERGHSLHAEPTQATLLESGAIAYVANSQWPSYDESGLRAAATQQPTHVLRLPLERH